MVWQLVLNVEMDYEKIYLVLKDWYRDSTLIQVEKTDLGMISANTMAGLDCMKLIVSGNSKCVRSQAYLIIWEKSLWCSHSKYEYYVRL